MGVVRAIFLFLRVLITSRSTIAAENLALRQELAVLSEQSNLATKRN